jgi:TRAP-type transport system periplasmic protein
MNHIFFIRSSQQGGVNMAKGEEGRFKVIAFNLVLVMVLALLWVPKGETATDEVIKLRLNENYTANHPMTVRGFKAWAKKVEEKANGRVSITVFADSTLAKVTEAYDATKAGVCDISMYVPAYAEGRFPLSSVMNLPIPFTNAAMAGKIFSTVYEKYAELKQEYADVKLLFFYCTPPYEIHTAKKPIQTAGDLKGLQIRATGPSDAKFLEHLQATPVAMPMPEAYLSLQKGVLDGVLSPFGPMKAFKTAEVTKYHTTNARIFSNLFCVVMNLDRWKALPPEVKKVFEESGGLGGAEMFGQVFDAIAGEDVKFMKDKGDTFTTIAPEERRKWKAAGEKIVEEWVKAQSAKNSPGKSILEEINNLVEKAGP